MVGIQDRFGQVGTEEWLKEEYGLTAAAIIDKVKRVLPRRKRGLFSL